MQSPRQRLSMKKKLILPLSLLFATLSTGCASLGRTELAPIPVDPEWRQGCPETLQPADPVTPSASLQFGRRAATEARCWKAIATGAIAVMDEHNARARPEARPFSP